MLIGLENEALTLFSYVALLTDVNHGQFTFITSELLLKQLFTKLIVRKSRMCF